MEAPVPTVMVEEAPSTMTLPSSESASPGTPIKARSIQGGGGSLPFATYSPSRRRLETGQKNVFEKLDEVTKEGGDAGGRKRSLPVFGGGDASSKRSKN